MKDVVKITFSQKLKFDFDQKAVYNKIKVDSFEEGIRMTAILLPNGIFGFLTIFAICAYIPPKGQDNIRDEQYSTLF